MNRSTPQRTLRLTTLALVLALAFGAGTLTGLGSQSAAAAKSSEPPVQFGVFWEAWNAVMDSFVDRDQIDVRRMTYGAIQGMLRTLEDEGHTTFMTPEEVQRHNSDMESAYEGIGATVTLQRDEITIVAPIDGSPAQIAGLLPGDVIMAVNGEKIESLTLTDVIGKIRGPAGTPVTLTVRRPSGELRDIRIVRDKVTQFSVSWSQIPGTRLAYVEITQFAEDTGRELARALWEIDKVQVEGGPIEGLILDLRNNPGGYLREAIRVSTQFLAVGDVILQEEDAAGRRTVHAARGRGWGREVPLVVLINQGSASAAEITAAALLENERALLVGETTFGTGTVLNQFDLSDGSALLLGVANWLTPSGRLIKGQGIEPTIPIPLEATILLMDSYQLQRLAADQLRTVADLQFLEALDQLERRRQPASASRRSHSTVPSSVEPEPLPAPHPLDSPPAFGDEDPVRPLPARLMSDLGSHAWPRFGSSVQIQAGWV